MSNERIVKINKTATPFSWLGSVLNNGLRMIGQADPRHRKNYIQFAAW